MSTPEPIEYPIDPDSPAEFPGKLPRELSVALRDQLQKIAEEVNPYLGPDHRAISALLKAAQELAVVTFPRSGQYAEYTPDE
ncbi:hypothetical protein [Nocardia gamkensis]|uniref:Uncharacterized protein n=1 Tax=Nocardia gamkensis TaxID=352869 RepID=A0A7X6L7G8_9NOCA|nr:hypothetical protein [Nocardia gamkensis]NKY29281.1 hypothetical protein [Nocardia gamkensis]NQE67122.1 hypothetical protein [Nocardia gamkensis]